MPPCGKMGIPPGLKSLELRAEIKKNGMIQMMNVRPLCNGMKLIHGQREELEALVLDLVFDSFKPDFTHDHDYIMAQIKRLEPQGGSFIHLAAESSSHPDE
jgi:hypothetical protein